jgi:hypothetical protein
MTLRIGGRIPYWEIHSEHSLQRIVVLSNLTPVGDAMSPLGHLLWPDQVPLRVSKMTVVRVQQVAGSSNC